MRRRSICVLAVVLLLAACVGDSDNEPTPRPDVPSLPPLVTVPNVAGLTTTQTDRVLQLVGLLLQVEPVGGGDDRIVLKQSPAPGSEVRPGSQVLVEARCRPAPCPFPGEGKRIFDPCTCAAR